MVLTSKQAEQYNNGTLDKSTFIKLLDTIDFDKYLLRYCKPIHDYRIESLNERVWEFNEFGYSIEVSYILGEFNKINYRKN